MYTRSEDEDHERRTILEAGKLPPFPLTTSPHSYLPLSNHLAHIAPFRGTTEREPDLG